MTHEAIERRICPHAEHEEVGNFAGRNRNLLQPCGALGPIRAFVQRHQQRPQRSASVRRHKLGHASFLQNCPPSRPAIGQRLGEPLAPHSQSLTTSQGHSSLTPRLAVQLTRSPTTSSLQAPRKRRSSKRYVAPTVSLVAKRGLYTSARARRYASAP